MLSRIKKHFITKHYCLIAVFLSFLPLQNPAIAAVPRESLAQAPDTAFTDDANKGKILFQRHCSACHYADTDKNKIGPSLYGVFVRKAGEKTDYNYSAAMKNAGRNGLTWTKENLESFLHAPSNLVPGTRMPPIVPHLTPTEIQNIIRYLSQDTQ